MTRLITVEDAPALTELVRRNRDFLAPWEPLRTDDYFTVDVQRAGIEDALARHALGTTVPHVILDRSGEVVGRITLSGIVRGPFQSCSLGYWVDEAHNGQGLATAAVGEIVRHAFTDLKLHRVQAETLPHNAASQKVLARNGFARIGLAPHYLNIAGRWQDHVVFQVVNAEPPGGALTAG
ncbi:MAG TPA: GNAT family N-acetyltransferase [Actinomycetes bacterium]|nr:GNAT family N-acetyltransferase [Actinomycetes bacterium]